MQISTFGRAALAAAALILAASANASAQTGPGPESIKYFSTLLEKDPSREVRLQQQIHMSQPGTAYHTHPGDKWEVVLEGEMIYQVRSEQPRVLKTGEWVYIPRGTIHRNENRSGKVARTIELLIVDKDKPQRIDAPAQ